MNEYAYRFSLIGVATSPKICDKLNGFHPHCKEKARASGRERENPEPILIAIFARRALRRTPVYKHTHSTLSDTTL